MDSMALHTLKIRLHVSNGQEPNDRFRAEHISESQALLKGSRKGLFRPFKRLSEVYYCAMLHNASMQGNVNAIECNASQCFNAMLHNVVHNYRRSPHLVHQTHAHKLRAQEG